MKIQEKHTYTDKQILFFFLSFSLQIKWYKILDDAQAESNQL